MPSDNPSWVIYADVQITRRKRWSYVCDHTGETVFNAVRLSECIDWVVAQDAGSVEIRGPKGWVWLDIVAGGKVTPEETRVAMGHAPIERYI